MLDIISISNPIFDKAVRDYHKWDNVDRPMSCDYAVGSLEYNLYKKCWIDVVQWHLEDLIRDPHIDPVAALTLKRRIDRSNQERTDMVEQLDEYFFRTFSVCKPINGASINTESPAWAVDRLSILHIKIWHMREQTERHDVNKEQHEKCMAKLDILKEQLDDLNNALSDLFRDYAEGKRVIKMYRQMKMYNDPNLNPVLYGGKK